MAIVLLFSVHHLSFGVLGKAVLCGCGISWELFFYLTSFFFGVNCQLSRIGYSYVRGTNPFFICLC